MTQFTTSNHVKLLSQHDKTNNRKLEYWSKRHEK